MLSTDSPGSSHGSQTDSEITRDSGQREQSPPVDSGGCPTPLVWRDVVTSFHEQRQLHEISVEGRKIVASTMGQGPPLYLLGGMIGDASMFALLVWLLREENTCVLFDWPPLQDEEVGGRPSQRQPGQTRSPAPHEELAGMAAGVLAVADQLGHDRIALHGTSFGCLVGLQLLLDAPQRVERASLQGADLVRKQSLAERALLWWVRNSHRTLSEFHTVSAIQRWNHLGWFPPFDQTRWNFYEEQLRVTPARQAARLMTIAGRISLESRLSEISTPVLVILCEGDGRVSHDAQAEMARRLSSSTVETLDNCGTLPHLTHPHRLAKLLRAFRDDESCHAS